MDGVEVEVEDDEHDDDLSCMTLTLKRDTLSHTYFVWFFSMHCSDQHSWDFIKDFFDFLATHFLVIF